jgi:tartrate dehydrogenase/decarboxylase/D-malate dehydrogenase
MGKGIANPLAMTLSGGMLLRHIGEGAAAASLDRAVRQVLEEGRTRTRDLGGQASTGEMAQAIIDRLTGA